MDPLRKQFRKFSFENLLWLNKKQKEKNIQKLLDAGLPPGQKT